MNDPSNGNKRAILRSTFSVKESMPVLTESERGSLLSPPASISEGFGGGDCIEGVATQTGLPGQEERVCGTPKTLPARLRLSGIVSACSTAPRRPDHTPRGSREGCLFWIKEGRTDSEESGSHS